jgi:hypothetical protein
MKILKNQTLYQCESCGKRLLTKRGALLHENEYCYHPGSPASIAVTDKQEACDHPKESVFTVWVWDDDIQVPDCDQCGVCGLRM